MFRGNSLAANIKVVFFETKVNTIHRAY